MKFLMGSCQAEYDFDAMTFTLWELDGVTVAETRAITEAERAAVDPNYIPAQVSSLNDAVNQLILDALMGGM